MASTFDGVVGLREKEFYEPFMDLIQAVMENTVANLPRLLQHMNRHGTISGQLADEARVYLKWRGGQQIDDALAAIKQYEGARNGTEDTERADPGEGRRAASEAG